MKKYTFVDNLFVLLSTWFLAILMQGCQQSSVTGGNQFVTTKPTVESSPGTQSSVNTIINTNKDFSDNKKMNNTESIRIDSNNLITNTQLGKIRLRMTIKHVKRFYPNAHLKIVLGTLDNAASDILVMEKDEKLVYFTTENFDEVEMKQLPDESDKIDFLMTDNPRFVTAEGITVGRTFGDAEKIYGKPKFFSNSFFDFITFDNASVNKMAFYFVHHKEANNSDRAYSPEMRITHIGTGK